MKSALRTLTTALILSIGLLAHAQESASLIPEKTEAQADLEKLDLGILRVAEALNHTAAVLTREHNAIWRLPDDRLLAVLNASVSRTIAIAQAKDKAAQEVNSLLNQLNISRYTNRAPIGLGREDVKFDQEAKLFVIIPPVEEPEPVVE